MQKKKSLIKSTYTVSIMTVFSRILGLAREIIFANYFGATGYMDAFLVAFKIPNFLRRLFAEGAFSQAFVPILSEYRQKQDIEKTKIFINRMAGTLTLVLFFVTLAAVILAPILIMIFAPGFSNDPSRLQLATSMLRITFPYLLLISLTAFLSAILNSYDVFSIPAITPILLNISLIVASIFLSPLFKQPVKALAYGVLMGGIAQLFFQFPFLKRLRLIPNPKIFWKDEGVKRVIKLMAPAILGVSVAQISLLIDTMFASFLKAGSITWLYFSDRLTNFPLGVFGIAIATVILPHLSRKHTDKSEKEYSASLDWALRTILLIGIPSAIGIFILSGPLLSTILQHGKFNAFDVRMSSYSTMAFAMGLPFFMLIKTLAASFYSKQDTKTPVRIAIIALIANIILALILIFPLAHTGLALATSLTAAVNSFLLFFVLRKRKIYTPLPGWGTYFLRLIFANSAMCLFLLFFSENLTKWISWSIFNKILHLSLLLICATIVYFVCLFISGLRLKDLKSH